MITIYLGRHGETRLNSEEKLRSWIDEPLNKDGIQEAKDMADFMADVELNRIYCSDLERAHQTALIVSDANGAKVIPRMWFRPLDYGKLSGKEISEIQPQLDALNEIWKTAPAHAAPGGESFEEFQDRNLSGLHSVISRAEDGDTIMIVAHLRNCLLFHAVAENGGPLVGDAVQMMDGKSWHQDSGSVSLFQFSNGQLKFVDIVYSPEENEKEEAVS